VIARAAILGRGRRLEIESALGRGGSRAPDEPAQRTTESEKLPTLEEATRRHIERALLAAAGRIEGAGGAAAILGINPHTLRARMRKLGLDWARFRRELG
jgi:DNA-binding NtrC family response regulator